MADIKITALPALAATADVLDVLAIVDVSDNGITASGTTKSVLISELPYLANGSNISLLNNDTGFITVSDFSNNGEAATANRDLGNTDAFGLSFITSGVGRINIESGGNVGIGTSTPTEKLEVAGNAKITGSTEIGLGIGTLGTSPSAGVALRTALNTTAISIGATGGATLYQFGDDNYLSSKATNKDLIFQLGLVNAGSFYQGATPEFGTYFGIDGMGSDGVTTTRTTALSLTSNYFNVTNQDVVAEILNVPTDLAGAYKMSFEVGGSERMHITETGQVNMSNIPTSSAGLSAGDIWNNSGVLSIV